MSYFHDYANIGGCPDVTPMLCQVGRQTVCFSSIYKHLHQLMTKGHQVHSGAFLIRVLQRYIAVKLSQLESMIEWVV